MLCQITQTEIFQKEFIAPIGKMGLAGKIIGSHWDAGWAAGAVGLAGAVGVCVGLELVELDCNGFSGDVLCFVATGFVGRYSGPC